MSRSETQKEHIVAYNAAYWEKNKGRLHVQQAAYRGKNKKSLAAQRVEYRKKNKERIAARKRGYWNENKGRLAIQRANYIQTFRNQFNDMYGLKKEGHEHGVCTCCGEADLTLFGTVSHIDGGGARHRELTNGSQTRVIKDALDHYNPSRFAAECFNCNLAAVRNNGICPHKLSQQKK